MCRALTLSPRASIADGGGPIQISPASITAWAKAAFSARKSVPRMNGVGATSLRDLQDLGPIEVGLGGSGPVERIRFVGQRDEEAVGVGVDGDARQTGVGRRPDDPYRDFASVGNEHFANDHESSGRAERAEIDRPNSGSLAMEADLISGSELGRVISSPIGQHADHRIT